jgi:hypothetical protein
VQHSFPFDHDTTLETNLQSVSEKLGEMEKYQGEMAMQSMFHR